MDEVLKYSQEDLEPILAEAKSTESKAGFVKSYLSGVTKSLINNPETYRSFGAYWWPLKELLIENGVTVFGDNLEGGTTERFRYESDEFTCCAAFAAQQVRLASNRLLDSLYLLDTGEGEVKEYILQDETMEKIYFMKSMRNDKPQ